MLLPGFPDNLICFAAGLTPIPVRKLMMAVVFGRFPSALVLTLLGDGWASAERNSAIYFISLGALLLTGIYLLMRPKVEKIIANSPFS
jgi:uncharacterized membrane protein YdjX (TVP38/TMEM64 family)